MRAPACLALLVGLALVAGCESTDPTQVTCQVATLDFTALNASVRAFYTWEIFEDSDGNGEADDVNGDGEPDFSLWCEPWIDWYPANSAPWNFSVQVDILRAGEVIPVTVVRSNFEGESFAGAGLWHGNQVAHLAVFAS